MHKPETLKNQALSNINISQDEGLWTDEDHRMRYVQAKRYVGGMGEAIVPQRQTPIVHLICNKKKWAKSSRVQHPLTTALIHRMAFSSWLAILN